MIFRTKSTAKFQKIDHQSIWWQTKIYWELRWINVNECHQCYGSCNGSHFQDLDTILLVVVVCRTDTCMKQPHCYDILDSATLWMYFKCGLACYSNKNDIRREQTTLVFVLDTLTSTSSNSKSKKKNKIIIQKNRSHNSHSHTGRIIQARCSFGVFVSILSYAAV